MLKSLPQKVGIICLMALSLSQVRSQCIESLEGYPSNFNTLDIFGQSFTACETGVLKQLDLPIHTFNPDLYDATLSIYQGEGYSGTLLHQQEIEVYAEWFAFYEYPLTSGIQVDQNSKYTIAIDFKGNYCGWWAHYGDLYPNGTMFWNPNEVDNYDFGFVARIEPEIPENIWIGEINSNWHTAANWSLQEVPNELQIAIIPQLGDNFMPIISDDAQVKSLQIFDGGSLLLDHNQELTVHHTLMNYGTAEFLGMVNILNDEFESEILGNNTFSHLKINNTVFLTEPVMVTDLLDLSSGYLMNMGSNLKVAKTEETKGHIYFPDNNVMGDIVIERKYNNQEGVQLISSPVGNTTLGETDVINSSGFEKKSLNQLVIKSFDEAQALEDFDNGWIVQSDIDAPLKRGAGYAADLPRDAVISYEGEVSSQSQLVSASFTSSNNLMNNGWHLLGNPYPSILDWESIGGSKTLDKAIYFWNNELQQFEVYMNDIRTLNADRYIQPMEGFFVRTSGISEVEVEYNEVAVKPDDIYDAPLMEVWNDPLYRLTVEGNGYVDETVFVFSDYGNDEFQGDLDAYKMTSLNGEIHSLASMNQIGESFAINTLPMFYEPSSYKLNVEVKKEGEYTFKESEIVNFTDNQEVYIEDKTTGDFHKISDEDFTVQLSPDADPNRFVLHFGLKDIEINGSDFVDIFSDGQDVIINILNDADYHVEIYSTLGQRVYNNPFSNKNSFLRVNIDSGSGYYMVKIHNEDQAHVQKIFIH